jgi:FKBP-type peptidyl-prolyl cis-trans isomerase
MKYTVSQINKMKVVDLRRLVVDESIFKGGLSSLKKSDILDKIYQSQWWNEQQNNQVLKTEKEKIQEKLKELEKKLQEEKEKEKEEKEKEKEKEKRKRKGKGRKRKTSRTTTSRTTTSRRTTSRTTTSRTTTSRRTKRD